VGEPCVYTLIVNSTEALDSANIELNIPSDSISPGLEIMKVSELQLLADQSHGFKTEITIAAEETGFFPINPLNISVNGQTYDTEPLLLGVHSTLTMAFLENIRDYKEGNQITYGVLDFIKDNWFWFVLGIAAIAGIVYLTLYLNSKKSKPKLVIEPEPVKIPALEIALEKFSELEKKNLWQSGRTKEYHSEISYILREYLEEELSISTLDKTSPEIITSLQKFHFEKPLLKRIQVSLSLTDLVKFAKQKPNEQENKQVLEDAKNAVVEINKNV